MNWLHSLDQLLFEVGARCHYREEFYRVMTELLDDRYFAVVSALSESYRSKSKDELASVILRDPHESSVNKLKSKATVLETRGRTVVAQPALDAALVEIACLEKILKGNTYSQQDMYLMQKLESELACVYAAFTELTCMGMITLETYTDLLNRGINFDQAMFEGVTSRDGFYDVLKISHDAVVTPSFLRTLHVDTGNYLQSNNVINSKLSTIGASSGLSKLLSDNGFTTEQIALIEG